MLAMGTDACILCEAKPPPPLTEEHVWPTWFSNTLPKGTRMKFTGTINGEDLEWPAQKLNIAPTCLCHSCNSDWAGPELEDKLAPMLKKMVKGEPFDLSIPTMQRLAAWITMKCMVLDCIRSDPASWFYTQEQRSYLRHQLKPPHRTLLWIGKYTGDTSRTGKADEQRSIIASPQTRERYGGWSVLFSIGKVLFQLDAIQGLADPARVIQVEQSAYDWDKAMYPLWPLPPEPYRWPPSVVIDEPGWSTALERFFDTPTANTPRRKVK